MNKKLYLIDWGESCNGGRYALIEAETPDQLILNIDQISDPYGVKFKEINNGDSMFYVELIDPNQVKENDFNEHVDMDHPNYCDYDELKQNWIAVEDYLDATSRETINLYPKG